MGRDNTDAEARKLADEVFFGLRDVTYTHGPKRAMQYLNEVVKEFEGCSRCKFGNLLYYMSLVCIALWTTEKTHGKNQ